MRIFTIQSAVNNALWGVYDSLKAIQNDWTSVITQDSNAYVVLESVVNLGILKRWQAVKVGGKVYWEVIDDDY